MTAPDRTGILSRPSRDQPERGSAHGARPGGGHMQKRSLGLSMFGSLAIIVAACGGGATPAPSTGGASQPAPSAAESAMTSEAPSESSVAMKPIKVGVVTDVGQLEDKSFNQSSNEGAKAAATESGGTHDVIVTQAISDYAANIQTLVDNELRRHRHRRLPDRDRHREGRQGPPGDQVHRRRPGHLRRRERRAGLHLHLCGRRGDAPPELPGHRLRRGPARLPRRHHRRQHHEVGHDRRHRRHERPGGRQLLARVRERREVGQAGHQGPLPGDQPGPGQGLQRPDLRRRRSPTSSWTRRRTSCSRSPA